MISSVNFGVPQKFVSPLSEAPAQEMPRDVLVHVVGKSLSLSGFAALAQVCTVWRAMIQPNIEKKCLEEVSFGKDKWLNIPGVSSVSEEPALTEEQEKWVIAKLKGNCRFFNEKDSIQPHRFENDKIKKTWQTQKLIFFPEKINGDPRTINSQNRLFHFIKEVNDGTAFEHIVGSEADVFRNQPAPKSYWALVTLDVVPGSRGISHAQKELLLTRKECRAPTPNEATTSNLIMNLGPSKEKKGYFFGREGTYRTYTATTELYNSYRLVVGAAAPSGPNANSLYDGNVSVGVAAVAEVP